MKIVLGKTSGFCYGVKRAVLGAEELSYDKLYCLGELVHNKSVINKLTDKGIIFIEDINEVEDNSNVIIRAHGVSKEIYKIAKEKNINLIDFTCPNVVRIHEIIESNKDKFIILCGDKDHPENIGSISFAENFYIINSDEEIEDAIKVFNSSVCKELLLISQTTFSVKKFNLIKEKILNINKDVIIYDTICKTTELRQKETSTLAEEVDMMIIIGGKNSSNTKKLYDEAILKNNNVLLIETKDDLPLINNVNSIGIMAGASTPEDVINDVINKLKEMENI